MTIKPIETRYDGHRFRSRLEARWAVFFDELGVSWDYEPQGFDLGELGFYLPDFWLEDHGCWFEVKGACPEYDSLEVRRLRALSNTSGSPAILAHGRIGDFAHVLFAYDLTDSSGGEFQGAGMWRHIDAQGLLTFGVDTSRRRVLFSDQYFQREIPWVVNESDREVSSHKQVWNVTPHKQVWNAYMAARGARFEHGENGRRR